MAAIDPTQPPETDSEGNVPSVPRATLKLIKTRGEVDEDDLDDDEEAGNYLETLLAEDDSDEEDDEEEEEEEEANGGPSDPAKSKKARREAALRKLLASAIEEESDEEMEDAEAKANGVKKGKEKASDDDEDDEDDESDSDDGFDLEEYVLCTLDTERVSTFSPLFFFHFLGGRKGPPPLLGGFYARLPWIASLMDTIRTTSKPWTSPLVRTRGLSSLSLEPMPFTSLATMSSPKTMRMMRIPRMRMTTIFLLISRISWTKMTRS